MSENAYKITCPDCGGHGFPDPGLLTALQAAQRVLAEIVGTNPTISVRDAYLLGREAEAQARAAIARATNPEASK